MIPTTLSIIQYMHCSRCFDELPHGKSMQSWAQLEVGFTKIGLQVWCRRHQCNIVHIDFQGCKHPASMLTDKDETVQV